MFGRSIHDTMSQPFSALHWWRVNWNGCPLRSVCVCARACMRVCVHACMHACMGVCVCVHAQVHTCVHTCMLHFFKFLHVCVLKHQLITDPGYFSRQRSTCGGCRRIGDAALPLHQQLHQQSQGHVQQEGAAVGDVLLDKLYEACPRHTMHILTSTRVTQSHMMTSKTCSNNLPEIPESKISVSSFIHPNMI